jgi:hypothetical protein
MKVCKTVDIKKKKFKKALKVERSLKSLRIIEVEESNKVSQLKEVSK